MSLRFSFALSLGISAAAMALSVASGAQAQPTPAGVTPQRGGTLIMIYPQDPTAINPALSTIPVDQTIGCMIYQGLVQVDLDYKTQPQLAKSWTVSPDGKTYSFDLRKANWQDGKPFTSEDVKYSLLEVNAKFSSVYRAAAERIESVETPAPDKVVIKLKEAFGPLMISLTCDRGGAIMPAHIYRGTDVRANPATTDTPVGTGAFKLVERKRNDYVRLRKNPDYWLEGRPYLDEIVVKSVTNATSRVQAVQSGEADEVPGFPVSSRAAILANPKVKIVESDTDSMNILFFNITRKPLDNKKVRQALAMATDREYFMKNAFFDVGSVPKNPMTTEIGWLENPKVDLNKMYPFNMAKANALLDEAGVKRGPDGKRFALKIVAYSNAYPELLQIASALKSMWGEVGVDVTTQPVETAALTKQVFEDRDFDVHMNAYGSYSDPALGIARDYITTKTYVPNGNPSGYSNPEVDELFRKGELGTNVADRAPHYQRIQEIIAEDMPAISLRQYKTLDVMTTKLWNVHGIAQGTGRYDEAWLEK